MNHIIFQFKNLLIIIQPDMDRVHIISWSGETCSLTIDETILILEEKQREKKLG